MKAITWLVSVGRVHGDVTGAEQSGGVPMWPSPSCIPAGFLKATPGVEPGH